MFPPARPATIIITDAWNACLRLTKAMSVCMGIWELQQVDAYPDVLQRICNTSNSKQAHMCTRTCKHIQTYSTKGDYNPSEDLRM